MILKKTRKLLHPFKLVIKSLLYDEKINKIKKNYLIHIIKLNKKWDALNDQMHLKAYFEELQGLANELDFPTYDCYKIDLFKGGYLAASKEIEKDIRIHAQNKFPSALSILSIFISLFAIIISIISLF